MYTHFPMIFGRRGSMKLSRHVYTEQEFHQQEEPPVYHREIGPVVFKQGDEVATVKYEPCHSNAEYSDYRQGQGRVWTKWLLSEDGNKAEGISESGINMFADFYMEPGASIGQHQHSDKEEIYYLLEGTLKISVEDAEGGCTERTLMPGDMHFIRLGQSHAALAGSEGARVVSVCVKG
ncbi:cupin domain-containing protein [Corallincola luteus]|uniref:Cupin domain-containing protein n=2 Tax=Corallincola luteus TaxID=1775177 RepID=A0ABY2AL91_9GAMM|nr:cupin domain-containing protein [Corallincola luteus]